MKITKISGNNISITADTDDCNICNYDFLSFDYEDKTYIGQINSNNGEIFNANLLFSVNSSDEVVLSNNFEITKKFVVNKIKSSDLFGYFSNNANQLVCLGQNDSTKLLLDVNFLKDKFCAFYEKNSQKNIIINNIVQELLKLGQKVIFFDFDGIFENSGFNYISNFRLPLNYNSLDYIYNNLLNDCDAVTKSAAQSIIIELQNYITSEHIDFIPFSLFCNIVSKQSDALKNSGLVFLKNKLAKFSQIGLFADKKNQFNFNFDKSNFYLVDCRKISSDFIPLFVWTLKDFDKNNANFILDIDTFNFDNDFIKKNNFIKTISYSNPNFDKYIEYSNNAIFSKNSKQNSIYSTLFDNEFIANGIYTYNIPLNFYAYKFTYDLLSKNDLDNLEQYYPNYKSNLDNNIHKELDNYQILEEKENIKEVDNGKLSETIVEYNENDYYMDTQDSINSKNEEYSQEVQDNNINSEIEEQVDKIIPVVKREDDDEPNTFLENTNTNTSININENENNLPIYTPKSEKNNNFDDLSEGITVIHAKYGKGVVEKKITYGAKTMYSIVFDEVGRRVLDPAITELQRL